LGIFCLDRSSSVEHKAWAVFIRNDEISVKFHLRSFVNFVRNSLAKMKKKVIDIFPPEKEDRFQEARAIKESEKEEILAGEKRDFDKGKNLIKAENILGNLGHPRNRVFILVFSAFILVFGFCYFTLPKAKIELWPEVSLLDFETRLTVDKNKGQVSFSDKVIPGEILTKEKTLAAVFSSTGKVLKEKKTEGIIRVYNAYSTSPQVLIATTRFVSTEGKLFRTPAKVTVPGGRYEKGKLIPGEIDIKVVADQPGPEYNIGPSVFSVPGFAGTDRYTKFYAKSFQQMTGGFAKELSQVTEADLRKAEDVLTRQAKDESEVALKNELKTKGTSLGLNFEPLESNIQTEIVEKFSVARSGDEVKDFNYQVKAKSETLIFKKEDLENFIKEFIDSQISQTPISEGATAGGGEGAGVENVGKKKIDEESLKIEFSPDMVDLKSGKMTLSLKISAKVYQDIDVVSFKNGIAEKSAAETKFFLESQPGVNKVEVNFWPFWVRKTPEDLEKIKIELKID